MKPVWYDTRQAGVDWKAECGQLNLAHVVKHKTEQRN